MLIRKSHLGNELWKHVATERNLEIPKVSFDLDGAHGSYAIDDEAVRFGCLLESLLAGPYKEKT